MSYNKEYYHNNKEKIKEQRDKYRTNNREIINKKQREKYQNLSEEEKEARRQKVRDNRLEHIEKTRLQGRLYQYNRRLKLLVEEKQKMEDDLFILKMKDTWDSSDYRFSDETYYQIKNIENKINKLEKKIKNAKKEMRNYK